MRRGRRWRCGKRVIDYAAQQESKKGGSMSELTAYGKDVN